MPIGDDPAGTATALLGDMVSEGDLAWLGRPENLEMMLADMAESARGDWEGYADDCIADASEWGFQLEEVKTKVALLHGTTDGVVPIEHSRYLKQALPNASLREVDGEGHISVVDHLPIRMFCRDDRRLVAGRWTPGIADCLRRVNNLAAVLCWAPSRLPALANASPSLPTRTSSVRPDRSATQMTRYASGNCCLGHRP